MKRNAIITGMALVLLVGFWAYGTFPRNDDHMQEYLTQLQEEGMMIEAGAMYAVELKIGAKTIISTFQSEDYFGSLKERAEKSISDKAEQDNIVLPDGFENNITITKVLSNVTP